MNTFFRNLVGSLALLATTTGAFAAAPATNAPPAAPAPASAKAAAPAKPASILDDYIDELAAALKLSDSEKKDIEACYLDDADVLKNILNNDALSPLEQAREVSDAREARNTKIEDLLLDDDRKQVFLKIEAKYRVALTELAANGGLVATPAPAPAAPAAAPAKPGTATDKPPAK